MTRMRCYAPFSNRWRAGDATQFFIRSSDLRPSDRVFLLGRESIESNQPKLTDQHTNLARVVMRQGAALVGAEGFVGPGYEVDNDYVDRPSWETAISRIRNRALRAGATHLLMETVDRGVRSRYFHPSKLPTAQARECDLKKFAELTAPLILVTDLDPAASNAEAAAYRSRRGQMLKGKRGGRPASKPGHKKAVRMAQKPEALKLHRQGYSLAEIGQQLGRNRSTIHDWIRSI